LHKRRCRSAWLITGGVEHRSLPVSLDATLYTITRAACDSHSAQGQARCRLMHAAGSRWSFHVATPRARRALRRNRRKTGAEMRNL